MNMESRTASPLRSANPSPPATSPPAVRLRWLDPIIDRLATILAALCLVASFVSHVRMMTYPGPQEANEPAAVYCTRLLAEGRNPYSVEEMPASAQFFGPLYNHVVLTLKPLIGTDYFAHRFLNAICLAGTLALIGRHMRRVGAPWGAILAAVASVYWMALDNIMISARPDALGWILFVAGLLAPAARDYSLRSCVFGLACALLAFHCKAYFIAAGGATLLGLGLRRSMRQALWAGALFVLATGASVVLTEKHYPLYTLQVFTMQRYCVAANSNSESLAMHTLMFAQRAWPFFLLMILGLAQWLAGSGREHWRLWRSKHTSAWCAFRPRSSIGVLGLVLLIFLPPVLLFMGRNGGATFTYHLHLLFPLLLVLASAALTSRRRRLFATVLLAAIAPLSLKVRWAPTDPTPYLRLEQLIREEPGEVYACAAATIPLLDHRKRVYADGFSVFVGFALCDGLPERFASARTVAERCTAVSAEIDQKIAARQYRLILTEEAEVYGCNLSLIAANYNVVETFPMPTYFGHSPIWVWRPKRADQLPAAIAEPH